MKSNNEILKLLKTIEAKKTEIAKIRDELIAAYNNLDDIISHLDEGIENLDAGSACIRAAVEVISQDV